MISRVNNDANNIFRNTHSDLSRIRSGSGERSESQLRDLSRKDVASALETTKDEVAYEIDNATWEQDKDWEKENFERAFNIFK